jgi:hypothetical protein
MSESSMSREFTKRYVDEVLEVSGIRRRGVDRIIEISKSSDQQIEALISDLVSRARTHYKKNLGSILQHLQTEEHKLNAYYQGFSPVNWSLENPDQFLRKTCLYYNKIVTLDRLEELESVRTTYTPNHLKACVSTTLGDFARIWPWIREGIVELIPSGGMSEDLQNRIWSYAEEDLQDARVWRPQVLRDEDRNLEGDALLRSMEGYLRKSVSSDFIMKTGGLEAAAVQILAFGLSADMGQCFFNSCQTSSSPSTDRRRDWRLFGCWILCRGGSVLAQELGRDRWESFAQAIKAGRAWLSLEAGELGVLMKLPPEEIIEIRNSADYSLQNFRKDLGDAVDEIEGLKLDDEAEYREAATQVWKKVRDDAREVRRDMDTIRSKIGARIELTFASLFLATLPFDIAKVAAALIGTTKAIDVLDKYIDLRSQKKSTGYFLVKLDEAAESPKAPSQRST